jgi:GNAT superfamily N-acetyltransferase
MNEVYFKYFLGRIKEESVKYMRDDMFSKLAQIISAHTQYYFDLCNHYLRLSDLWAKLIWKELESFAISPEYQRKGIGNMMIERWFKDTDIIASGKDVYVFSSAQGKGLYERFEWKAIHELVIPLDDFTGKREDCVNWSMLRKAKTSEKVWCRIIVPSSLTSFRRLRP